ncbi:hypothetical protein GCM10023170_096100 [Phytohabitans houttuyneae]|uniref:Uncharacterized protein n=1 Tax=Phytohabitans houttuyneae TaxID=1076126 RepID=A0A6V8KCJ7_9ACTN|nr:hypothetical protein Phou_053500 [Phytohabitans houttuyneae]
MLQPKVFHEFQPIGGVLATPLFNACAGWLAPTATAPTAAAVTVAIISAARAQRARATFVDLTWSSVSMGVPAATGELFTFT